MYVFLNWFVVVVIDGIWVCFLQFSCFVGWFVNCKLILLLGVKVFINVPWWYVAYNRLISPFLTQRTKSKFVFAGPTKTAETLFKSVKIYH